MSSSSSRHLAPTLDDHGVRWEVLSHDVLPRATIAWLRVMPLAEHLRTAAQTRELVIEETGTVPRLRIQNPSAHPVFLQADLVVDGGKQARVIERSVIVRAGTVVEVPVRCVEAGRWGARDAPTANRFAVAAPAGIASREHLAKLKQRGLREKQHYELDQREVWNHVSAELGRTRCASPTQSYTASLARRAEHVAEAKRLAICPPPGANALALFRAGAAVWIEVLPSPTALAATVPNLVADLLTTHDDEAPASSVRDPRGRASDAMAAVVRAALVPLEPVPLTEGRAYAIDVHAITGSALLDQARIAHLTASVTSA